MLSFRQITSVVWTFLLFMVGAALVLNLRYKPLREGEALYLDTWTGKVRAAPAVAAAEVVVPEMPKLEVSSSAAGIILLERLRERQKGRLKSELDRLKSRLERQKAELECQTMRFAFPAPVKESRR